MYPSLLISAALFTWTIGSFSHTQIDAGMMTAFNRVKSGSCCAHCSHTQVNARSERWRGCLIESKNLSEWKSKVGLETSNLGETNGGGLFAETLTTKVNAVFANDTGLVGAQTAEGIWERI